MASPMNVTSPSKIEAALQQLSSAVTGPDSSEAAPTVKSRQANFVILVDTSVGGPLALKVLNDTIARIASKQLYRFFVLNFDSSQGSEDRLDAAVNSRQLKLDSGMFISSEEIYLTFGAGRVKSIKNLLLSLYVPDVEIIVLALTPNEILNQNEFFPLFKEIVASADKVLYDSEYLPKGASRTQLCKLSPILELRGDHEEGTGVWDLSWMRTRRWRILVAESFESQELLAVLPQLERVTISELVPPQETDRPEPLPKCLLLAGWILSRLGISAESVARKKCKAKYDGHRWSYVVEFGSRSFEILFESAADERIESPVISMVTFDFPSGRNLRIKRDFTKAEASIILDGETRTVPFVPSTFDQLAMQVISAGRDSERFQGAHALALHFSTICK